MKRSASFLGRSGVIALAVLLGVVAQADSVRAVYRWIPSANNWAVAPGVAGTSVAAGPVPKAICLDRDRWVTTRKPGPEPQLSFDVTRVGGTV